MKRKANIFTWKNCHRWGGILVALFLVIFCFSGIILNHREVVSGCDISRTLMPSSYIIRDYNNGIIRGTLRLGSDSVLAYGYAGAWLTDKTFSDASDFNNGLPQGVDRRNIRNIIRNRNGETWCAAQYDLYQLKGNRWERTPLPGNTDRISDIALAPDSIHVVAMTRSAVYVQSTDSAFTRHELPTPFNHNDKITLFKSLWMLHSGELFGTPGRIIVDIIALIILLLSITGIFIFLLPYSIRRSAIRSAKTAVRRKASLLKWNFRWHNRIGYFTILFTIIIAFTGMCLRPPLMIPAVLIKTHPLPGSALDSPNPWHDKLRALRWDEANGNWLISTSDGFIRADKDFSGTPVIIPASTTPPVSPMGINVFEQIAPDRWLIGSFSGLYEWDTSTGDIIDHITATPYAPTHPRQFASGALITGYSSHLGDSPVWFDYSKGTDKLNTMPEVLSRQPISLWNFALELHVGRCYTPFLGPFSELFVFLSGALLLLILISGFIIYRRLNSKNQ